MSEPCYMYVNTSATASSRGLAHCIQFGLNSCNTADFIDWTKRLELSFTPGRAVSNANAIARVQLKEATTEGILAAKGIGVQISNYTMVGEAWGSARQTTGTLKTLTDNRITRVKIVVTSTSVEFWVDGVLVESLTGTAVPVAASTVEGYLVVSIINGVTTTDTYLVIGNIGVVQAW